MSELPAKSGDPPIDHPAIGLELRLTRTARADPALGPRQMGPHALQPRAHVLQLGKLDLESGLGRSGPKREYIEDELGPVHDANADPLLQGRALSRREIFVKHDEGGGTLFGELPELVGLSPSYVRGRVW